MRKIILIRVAITLILGIVSLLATIAFLRPRPEAPGSARYMHCDVCGLEMAFNPKLAGGRCLKCQPPKFGTLIATRDSVGRGAGSPWRSLNIALSCELVFLLGVVVFILSHPPRATDLGYGYTQCKNCGRRLRYPASRAGTGGGWCPLCKAVFAYPLVSDAPGPHDEYGED